MNDEKLGQLRDQLLARVGDWFDRSVPRVGVFEDGATAKLEIDLFPGDEGWDDDGNRVLTARLHETYNSDDIEGIVPDRHQDPVIAAIEKGEQG